MNCSSVAAYVTPSYWSGTYSALWLLPVVPDSIWVLIEIYVSFYVYNNHPFKVHPDTRMLLERCQLVQARHQQVLQIVTDSQVAALIGQNIALCDDTELFLEDKSIFAIAMRVLNPSCAKAEVKINSLEAQLAAVEQHLVFLKSFSSDAPNKGSTFKTTESWIPPAVAADPPSEPVCKPIAVPSINEISIQVNLDTAPTSPPTDERNVDVLVAASLGMPVQRYIVLKFWFSQSASWVGPVVLFLVYEMLKLHFIRASAQRHQGQ